MIDIGLVPNWVNTFIKLSVIIMLWVFSQVIVINNHMKFLTVLSTIHCFPFSSLEWEHEGKRIFFEFSARKTLLPWRNYQPLLKNGREFSCAQQVKGLLCHCSGSGCCCGMDLNPGTSICLRHSQKKKKKKKEKKKKLAIM